MKLIENEDIAIVIPLYKEDINEDEQKSLEQALMIFANRHIIFVSPKDFDFFEFKKKFLGKNDCTSIIFDSEYFESVEAYNLLMLSKLFYLQFSSYKYILVYQLDAYVFKDELNYWCNLGLDYIGAPWFTDDNELLFDTNAGNGGFSLRNVHSFLGILNVNKIVYSPRQLFNIYNKRGIVNLMLKVPLLLLRVFGYHNNVKYLIDKNNNKEDLFWANVAPLINKNFTVAKSEIAIRFAFEQQPTFLYKKNNNELPFGCHAWKKYDFDFWEEYIENDRRPNCIV
ncbi:MAG: DUF5672 family protein [Paludibacter sp.]|nr:DUF5672 family protein [Paludibacter sp.]